jgi:SAM-dependent methyltransferase
MTNRFQTFFEAPYDEIKTVIARNIRSGDRILDLGCNNGNLEEWINEIICGCTVYAVDIDSAAVDVLKGKRYGRTEVVPYVQDANAFLKSTSLCGLDTILINTTLHEINNFGNQAGYLDGFFSRAKELLGKGGRIIVGDYFYPQNVSDEEVRQYMEYQQKAINHADARGKFVAPELLRQRAEANGFETAYSDEIRAVEEIDRRYYTFVFRLKNDWTNVEKNDEGQNIGQNFEKKSDGGMRKCLE